MSNKDFIKVKSDGPGWAHVQVPTLLVDTNYVLSNAGGTILTNAALIGDTGATGPTGIAGATGVKGNQGNKGEKGNTGSTGAVGATGSAANFGSTGHTGNTGIGIQGNTGNTGPTGTPGTAANFGATGNTGPQGPGGDRTPYYGEMFFGYNGSPVYCGWANGGWQLFKSFTIGQANAFTLAGYGGANCALQCTRAGTYRVICSISAEWNLLGLAQPIYFGIQQDPYNQLPPSNGPGQMLIQRGSVQSTEGNITISGMVVAGVGDRFTLWYKSPVTNNILNYGLNIYYANLSMSG